MSPAKHKQLTSVQPFLRWAGGKRWLARLIAPKISEFINSSGGRYFEPFLGGGAMFFAVAPSKAHLSDNNADLISTFCLVRDRHREIQELVRNMGVSAENYYKLRATTDAEDIFHAARFIFLNRTCYGGIHRTNQSGQFNVPYGGGSRTPENLWKRGILESAALLLQHSKTSIECCDFAKSINRARRGDVVYCDPTYQGVTRAQFDRYGSEIFCWVDQERLAECALKAAERGALVIISNGASKEIQKLFSATNKIALEKKKTIGRPPRSNEVHREMLYVYSPKTTRVVFSSSRMTTVQPRRGNRLNSKVPFGKLASY
jgi:DNA adenine methylase